MQTTTSLLAKHLREVYIGGNWTTVNLCDTLAGLSWQQATTSVQGLNSIATLVFHLHYYVRAVSLMLDGEPLQAKDELSFAHPPLHSQADWEAFIATLWPEAEAFAAKIEQLSDSRLSEAFAGGEYGSYYRNLQGIIEHIHYHLGQISLLKKYINANNL